MPISISKIVGYHGYKNAPIGSHWMLYSEHKNLTVEANAITPGV
jgi:hypothetical protein